MANWNLPTITSGYINFVDEMNAKFIDSATLFNGSNWSNIQNGFFRFNRSTSVFQEWIGVINGWQDKILSVAGGGTGATTSAGIIVNLGLGSMSTQNSNAVNITGGSITGVTVDAGGITSGVVALARGGTGNSLAQPPYGWIIVSNGANMVMDPGTAILQLNADRLVMGTVPLARLSGVGLLATDNVWGGINSFYNAANFNAGLITINGGYPGFFLINNIGAANQHRMFFFNYQGNFIIQYQNDDGSFIINALTVDTSGIISGIGSGLINLNASNLATGIVPIARLGAGGAPNTTTFLRGDNTWQVPPGGGGGTTVDIPSGLIAMFDTACPAGWTRVAAADNRFLVASTSYGVIGGASTHRHHYQSTTGGAGSHSHGFSGSGGISGGRAQGSIGGTTGGASVGIGTVDAGASFQVVKGNHTHDFGVNVDIPITGGSTSISGSTDGVGNHAHSVDDYTDIVDHNPLYFSVVLCRKN